MTNSTGRPPPRRPKPPEERAATWAPATLRNCGCSVCWICDWLNVRSE